MRRFLGLAVGAGLALALRPSAALAQGFGVYEHNTCAMGRAGTTAASPCPDGSAIFFNPAGLAGLSGTRASAGATLIFASGSFTSDVLQDKTDLDNPAIPIPNVYVTHAFSPKLTAGIGMYVPYGLETRWPTAGFQGRFLGYNSKLQSIYIQPTVGYQVTDRLAIGGGIAYVMSKVVLRQRVDLSQQVVPAAIATPLGLPAGTRFSALGVPTGTDFADADLQADGTGISFNIGGTFKVTDRLTVGGHWLWRTRISYEGDAVFERVPTGLIIPTALGPLPAGTPVDNVVSSLFVPGAPLADGTATTKIWMPPQGSLGLAYKPDDQWTVLADWHHVLWGYFNNLQVDFANAGTPDINLYEGYHDTNGFRFGAEYRRTDKLTLRGGYLYHTAAAPAITVTPLLPEGARNEFTLGASLKLTPQLNGDFGYQYITQNDRRGRVHDAAVGNTGLYAFSAHLFGLGFAYTF